MINTNTKKAPIQVGQFRQYTASCHNFTFCDNLRNVFIKSNFHKLQRLKSFVGSKAFDCISCIYFALLLVYDVLEESKALDCISCICFALLWSVMILWNQKHLYLLCFIVGL